MHPIARRFRELAGVRAEREKCIQLLEDSEKRVTERTWAQRLAGELAGVRAERNASNCSKIPRSG